MKNDIQSNNCTMRILITFTLALFCLTSSFAQLSPLSSTQFIPAPDGYWLGAEEYATHTGGALDGQTTWRIYIHCVNESDYLSSVSGDGRPLDLTEDAAALSELPTFLVTIPLSDL